MVWKSKEAKQEYYEKNKDWLNAKRREHSSKPEVKARIKLQDKKWRDNHKEEMKIRNKSYSKKYKEHIKELVFNHYGRKCSCCGEDNPMFLSIDHVDGGGTKHRKEIKNHLNIWLVNNNFPKGFETLCFNCNWGKYINGGICPHKSKLKPHK